MPSWLQALLAVCAFWLAAALVGARTGLSRLVHLWAAGLVLLAVALVLDALGVAAAGWAALLLVVSLFVVSAAFHVSNDHDAAP